MWLYQSLDHACFNNCSGRPHACDVGVCNCGRPERPRWSGLDCATVPPPEETGSGGFIYIYDVGADLGLRNFRLQAARSRKVRLSNMSAPIAGDPIYAAEAVFLERLLQDWSVRTTDPSKASLFFVPAFQYNTDGNLVLASHIVGRLRRQLRHWGRAEPNGADHVFFLTGDKGSCGSPPGPVYISHFAFSLPWACFGHEEPHECERQVARASAIGRPRHETMPCADDRSIVVPTFWTRVSRSFQRRVQKVASRHEQLGSWPYELFFSGDVRSEAPYVNKFLNLTYSQGVRQSVFAHWRNSSRYWLGRRHGPSDNAYGSARFCLAPSGDGFGWRLAKIVMLGGCVPLIIQPRVRQPFDTVLPYHNFSITLEKRDIPQLDRKLRDVGPERHAAMRRAMGEHAHAFGWKENGAGDAYDVLIRALRGIAAQQNQKQ